jgi:hypothetical protein
MGDLIINGVVITKQMAQEFEDLRKSGICNMWGARQYLGWKKQEFLAFMNDENYGKIMNHFEINLCMDFLG